MNVSLMDSDEALESKILTGHEGYDIVFPSPYVFKHMTLDVYVPLTEDKIPNLALIDKNIFDRFKSKDKILVALYLWGTTGLCITKIFLINYFLVKKLIRGRTFTNRRNWKSLSVMGWCFWIISRANVKLMFVWGRS